MPNTFYSTQRTAQIASAGDFSDRLNDARQISGAVQYSFIDVPLTTGHAATDIIELIELPPGAIVIPELSRFIVSDAVTALSADVGDVLDPDRYCDGASLSATGTVEFLAPAFPDAFHNRHQVVKTGAAASSTNLVLLKLMSFTASDGAVRVVLAWKSL